MLLFRPDRHFTRVTAIDPARDLRDAGISCVLLDMDNTRAIPMRRLTT